MLLRQAMKSDLICMIFILAFAESVGLWFLDNKLSIPPGRMTDARIVFQMSLVIVMIEVFRVPYNAMITAYERMQFYAYNSIVEAENAELQAKLKGENENG